MLSGTGTDSGTVGAWRSLVAYLHGVQGVGGSNPLDPTNDCNHLLVQNFASFCSDAQRGGVALDTRAIVANCIIYKLLE